MPKSYNPYYGWFPISFEDSNDKKYFSSIYITWPLGAVEDAMTKGVDIPMDGLTKAVRQHAVIHLNSTALKTIVDRVRTLILDWSLELEKVGILGEKMQFTSNEKKVATQMTINYNIHGNVGVLGNINDHAKVENHISVDFDVEQIKNFITQALQHLPSIDDKQVSAELKRALENANQEIMNGTQNFSKIKSILQSICRICEGATGNLLAQGIASGAGRIIELFFKN